MGGVRVIPIRTLHQLHQVGGRVLLIELVNTFQNALRFPVSVSLLLLKSPLLLCVALLLLYGLPDPLSLLRKWIPRPFVIRSSGGHPGRSRWLRTMRPRLDDVGHARSEVAPIVW